MAQRVGNLAAIVLVCFAGWTDRSRAEEKPDPAAHTVIVPYDLAVPRDAAHANRFYLDYTEFQKLWELAKENRRPSKPDDLEAKAKPEAFINSALYDARVEDDKLIVSARLAVLSRGAKWAKLPLPFKGDGLTVAEVKLDGSTAIFEKGEVLIENPGAHAVDVTLHMLRGRAWKTATIEVPRTASAMLALSTPVTDGRPVFGDSAGNAMVTEETRGGQRLFTLPLGAANRVSIARTPGRKLVVDVPPAQSDAMVTLQVLPRLEKVSAEVSFNFPGTERRMLTVELDSSLRLENAESVPPAEAIWRKEGPRQFVDFRFAQSVADAARVTIHATRIFDVATGNRTSPMVLGVAMRRGSTVDLQFSGELQVKVDAAGVERVSAAAGESGAGSYRVPAEKTLRYVVANAGDRSRARVEAVHQFTAQKAEIIAAITLDSGRAPLANARLDLPGGFEVQTLTGPRVKSWHRDGASISVQFDMQPVREAKLALHVAKTLAQPAASWKLEPLRAPEFAKQEGVVLIAVHAADEVKLTFDGTDGKLREVDPETVSTVLSVAPPFQLKRALTAEKAAWSAEVTLTRQAPRFSADAILLARASDLGLSLSQQVGLVVEQGALGGVKVRLPSSLPEARVHGAMVRDAKSKIDGESREYEVSFQSEALDRADFTMDYDLPLEGEKDLPSLQIDGAARVRRFVIVDNAGAHEMKLDPGGAETTTRDALPYLPEGLARPQFLRTVDTAAVKLSFTQLESTAGNAAIITLAEITTALRASGERWETVVYSLANRSLQFLPVRLPEGAELVEVSVGGQAVRADRAEISSDKSQTTNSFLVPLIQMRAGELSQQVRLVYRIPGTKGVEAEHRFRQPELVGLSAERTLWNVWVPEGFAAKKFDGNMEEIGEQGSELEKLQSELSDIARLNRVISSGSLSREETAYAWGNANKKIAEVKQLQSDNRGKSLRRSYETVDEAKGERFGKVVNQLDAAVEKQIQEQSTLVVNNGTIVEKTMQEVSGMEQGIQIEGRGGKRALQTWGFNNDAPQEQKAAPQYSLNYASAGMVDLNDNISLNGGEFFKSPSQRVSGVLPGKGAVTKTGAGTLTINGTGDVAGSAANILTSNARAGQNAQVLQQAGNAGTITVGNPAVNGGATLPLGSSGVVMNTSGTSAIVVDGGSLQYGGAGSSNTYTGGTATSGGALDVNGRSDADGALSLGGVNTYTGMTTVNAGTLKNLGAAVAGSTNAPIASSDPFAPAAPRGTVAATPAPAPSESPSPAQSIDGAAKSDLSKSPSAEGSQTDVKRVNAALTHQLKSVGRVSLAVDVPLDGKVFHFSKLKDHALVEVTILKPFDARQSSALWALGAGMVLLSLYEFARRRWRRRRGAAAL